MTDHITNRTAVYGPVRTVVWEGPGRKARPYPDRWQAQRRHRITFTTNNATL